MLYNLDCLSVMKSLPDEYIDMIYLDPPFYTQKVQSLSDVTGRKYEFSDTWDSLGEYLDFIGSRVREMRRILKPTGGIFLHCGTSASHHLRLLLDDIFGADKFRSEIIWSYRRWSNSKKGLMAAHQTIFYYTKGEKYKFNTLFKSYSAATNVDQILQERERDSRGKAVYRRDSEGNIVASGEKRGVPISDVWEIPFLNPRAKERTGYPTQKPVELLERIIKISTNPGDRVLDPFCGSGTTLVSAKLLGRDYIGIDTNKDAIELSRRRLAQPYKTVSALLRDGEGSYRTKTAEELSVLSQFDCEIVQRNKGIDAFLRRHYSGCPVAIRIQREHEPFWSALSLLKRASDKKGCSYGVLITHEKGWTGQVPANIFVINRYGTQLEIELEERIAKSAGE